MKISIIAALTPSGVIGRTSKPCEGCSGRGFQLHHVPYSLREQRSDCEHCTNTGRIPCNDLPWGRAYREDLERFKALTMGHAIAFGRRTVESIGRALPGRTNIMVSPSQYRDVSAPPDPQGFKVVPTLERAIGYAKYCGLARLLVGGGARLFSEALPIADTLELTLIGREYEGDVRFPEGFVRVPVMHAMPDGKPAEVAMYQPPAGGASIEFDLVSREPCPTNADLIFSKWVR